MREFDVRDLACPGPVLKLRELLDEGEREIRFHVADELCRSNVTRFAASRNIETEVVANDDGTFKVSFHTGGGVDDGPTEAQTAAAAAAATAGPTIVQISADTMGAGDDELGALLLRSFVKTLPELDALPDAVVFYNSGVKLCCSGSLLLDDIKALGGSGVEIIACGTCLNFFELADQLRVGRVTDMLEIAGRLAEAGSIVRP
mgnify:FL=1